MKKYFFSFLFLFFSACSPDSTSDKSDDPFPAQTPNKPPHQEEEPDLAITQQPEPDKDVSAGVDTSTKGEEIADTGVAANTIVEPNEGTGPAIATNTMAEPNEDTGPAIATNTMAEPNEDTGPAIATNTMAEPNEGTGPAIATNTMAEPNEDTDVAMSANAGETPETSLENPEDGLEEELRIATAQQAEISPDAGLGPRTGADEDINTAQNPADRTKLADFNVEGTLIQEETCEGFSKIDWTNQDLSIEQSIQQFIEEQIQNFLSMNREFPSPQDKEDSIRCFVNIAFSLNKIFQIATNHEWKQVSLQVPLEEALRGYIELFIIAHVGFVLLPPIKSIPSDRIFFVVEEPHLVKTHQYRAVINFNIMSRSKKIVWTVDAQSFPKELALLDISVEGVSILHQLKGQISGLFQRKKGNMNEIVIALQDIIDGDPFANL